MGGSTLVIENWFIEVRFRQSRLIDGLAIYAI